MTTLIRISLLSIGLLTLGCGDSRSVNNHQDSQPEGDSHILKLDGGADADPTCPAAQPTPGSACSVNQPCSYEQQSGCPCGPKTIWHDCSCVGGRWSCQPSDYCKPCMDSGPDLDSCSPVPSCNWCSGSSITDAKGCTTGYVCANGVDPCSTQPCQKADDCKPTEICKSDMLCWPGGP